MHIFIIIFQMEPFFAMKFAMGYEKKMMYFFIPKSPKAWKKVVKFRLSSFKLNHLQNDNPVKTDTIQNTILNLIFVLFLLKGVLHPYVKVNCPKNSKMALKF